MEKEPKIMTTATKNATKRYSVSQHLVNNRGFANILNLSRFKIIHQCNNVTDLIKMKAFFIYLDKPALSTIKCLYLVIL